MAIPSREQFWQTWSQQVLKPLVEEDLRKTGNAQSVPQASRYINNLAAPYYLRGELVSGGAPDTNRALWGNLNRFEQDYLNLWRNEIAKETEAQTNVQNIYSQILTETQKQAGVIKKQAEAVLNQQQNLARQEAAMSAARQSQQTNVTQRRRASIGQPGVARTRLSTGTTVGGYSGTSPGRINPTGLNI